jgi:glycosyltransferase involved in cell wall biosynthesis
MIIVFFVLTAAYLLLIGSFIIGFNKVKSFTSKHERPQHKFSIIIPFRNEVENLPGLIKSLEDLNYPKHFFEVILVDDNSTDDSQELALRLLNCTQLDFHILNNSLKSNSPKKQAITTGISNAKYKWIITTDADCHVPNNWLNLFNDYLLTEEKKMIVAPVILSNSSSIFDQFQTLEILSLQGVTLAGFGIKNPIMCNGANLCYSKHLFNSLNGFVGNNAIASGDDIFLMEKALKQNKEQVGYLKSKDAIVETKPEESFNKMLQQRIRWASKSTAYNSWKPKLIGLIIFAMNSSIIIGLVLTIFGLIKWWLFLVMLISKQLIDYLLLSKSATFFDRRKALNTYFFSSLIYPFISVYTVFKAMFSNYEWKGRTFKK